MKSPDSTRSADFDVVLDDGVELRLSRRYRSRLLS